MTEKLLSKPPFRYLHDIFKATNNKTGWGKGLFEGDQLNSSSYEDFYSKLQFIVKLVTLTEKMSGEKIDVKPNFILTGEEPDKTNVWL
jgi:TRAF3-interacting protein 1